MPVILTFYCLLDLDSKKLREILNIYDNQKAIVFFLIRNILLKFAQTRCKLITVY